MRQFTTKMRRRLSNTAVLAAALATACAGCGTVSTDSTLQQLLDASGLGGVTVSDVLGSIQEFTGNSAALPFGQTMNADQQGRFDALRAQHDAGEIAGAEYGRQVDELLGAPGAGRPFEAGRGRSFGHAGFRGGPLGMGGAPRDRLAARLDLTDEQKTQAQTIFDAMREEVLALQNAARDQIDALLTEEQRQQLDEMCDGFQGGFRLFGHGLNTDVLSDRLDLTEEQQTQVQAVLDQLRTDADARRQQARDAFRAILTTEQAALLDELEANHPGPKA